MNDLTKDPMVFDTFRHAPPLSFRICEGDYETIAEKNYRAPHLITIYECDLDVREAKQLRDWLNKVLPTEQAGDST